MPAEKSKSDLIKKLGSRLDKAVRSHANDTTEYGIIQLPPGITNGIAQVKECTFGEFKEGTANAGQPYFRASAVVVEPQTVMYRGQEVKVAGLQTSIMIPMCDTVSQAGKETPLEDNIKRIMNELRKLAGEEYTKGCSGGVEMLSLAEGIESAQPYTYFSTTLAKKKNPADPDRIWENWHGSKGLESYEPGEPAGAMAAQDDLEAVDDDEPVASAKAPTKKAPSANGKTKAPVQEEFDEFQDLDSLVERADADDEAAIKALTDQAKKAGISKKVINDSSYADLAKLIAGESVDEEETTEEEEVVEDEPQESTGPQVGEVFSYRPVDKATKKPGKATEVEIIEIDEESQTCRVKILADGKILKGVPLGKLEN